MSRVGRAVVCVALGVALATGLLACGKNVSDVPASESAVTRETTATEQTPDPLPDEQLYADVVAVGLAYSYDLTLEDGTFEVWQNVEGYGVVRWTDDEGREIVVTHRYVEGEPEEWVYSDEGAAGDGVTELSPTGAQLQTYDALAQDILTATTAGGALTRTYSWTSESGIGSVAYSTVGVTDDPNLSISFGPEERLGRFDLTIR